MKDALAFGGLCLLLGCANPESSVQDPGQIPPEEICTHGQVLDNGLGECLILVCKHEVLDLEFKPKGWWCLLDHPEGVTTGMCNGLGSCQQ